MGSQKLLNSLGLAGRLDDLHDSRAFAGPTWSMSLRQCSASLGVVPGDAGLLHLPGCVVQLTKEDAEVDQAVLTCAWLDPGHRSPPRGDDEAR